MTPQYQTLTLVLAGGRRLTYAGRVQIVPGDPVAVVAGPATDLPPGCSWEAVADADARRAAQAAASGAALAGRGDGR